MIDALAKSPPLPRIGYVVKRYPRYSETFIVNEILAHEAAGAELAIFALRPPSDTHFQDRIARVRAAVTYLDSARVRGDALWQRMRESVHSLPGWATLLDTDEADVQHVHQAMELALAARRQRIEHLHAHFATSAAAVALLAGQLANIPVTFTAHAKDIYHESVCEQELGSKLERAHGVVTVSEFNAADLRARFPHATSRLHRIYNGLDLDDFAYHSSQQRAPAIIAVGRLIEKKGFADLIAACRLLRDRGLTFTCDILGDGELAPALQTLIRTAELTDTVRLLGPQPQREVIRRVREASVLAAPCVVGQDGNRDGMPTVILEAMALGTPCVATDVTGIPEALTEGVTGRIVPQHAPEPLADRLAELLGDPVQRQRLATNARAKVVADFNIAHSTARLRELFQSCQLPRAAACRDGSRRVAAHV